MATVTEAVKESLLGTEHSADLSLEARARFLTKAKQDEDGEYYLNKEEFIDLIAPPGEDYVSSQRSRELLN